MSTKNKNLILFLYFSILFINYEIFAFITSFLIIITTLKSKIIKFDLDATKAKIIISAFYILKYLSAILNIDTFWASSSLKSYFTPAKFVDMQAFLFPIKCRAIESNVQKFKIYGTENYYDCAIKSNYGPIDQFIIIDFDLTIVTFLFSLLLILLYINSIFNLINSFEKNVFLLTIIALSPPINFLIQRMNIDLFIFLVIHFAYKKLSGKQMMSIYLLLMFLSLLKIYVIFVFFGFLLFNYFSKNYRGFFSNLAALSVSLGIYTYFGYFRTSQYFEVRPFRPDRSYGFLSEVIKLEKLGFKYLYFVFIFSYLIYAVYLLKNSNLSVESTNIFKNKEAWPYLFLFLGTCLYANYDYRISILIFISYIFFKVKNIYLFIFLIFIYSHPSIIHGYNESFAIVESYFIFYLDTIFLIFFYLINKDFILYFKYEIYYKYK